MMLLFTILAGWLGGSIFFYLEGTVWSPDPTYSHKSLMLMCMLWPVFGLCQLLCWLSRLAFQRIRRIKPNTVY